MAEEVLGGRNRRLWPFSLVGGLVVPTTLALGLNKSTLNYGEHDQQRLLA